MQAPPPHASDRQPAAAGVAARRRVWSSKKKRATARASAFVWLRAVDVEMEAKFYHQLYWQLPIGFDAAAKKSI